MRSRDSAAATISPPLLFACVLGLLAAGTAIWWTVFPARVGAIARAARPSDDYYLALDQGGHVDHHVLFHGTDGEALAALRRADVLLLGNSRLMFAARPGVLDAYFASRGERYYILGFGFREMDRFPLALIEKFDLRPRLVVVNADGFFLDELSEFARAVMDDSRFDAWKRAFEAERAHEARRALHPLVPNLLQLLGRPGYEPARELIIYRSRTHGAWQISPWESGRPGVPARDLAGPPLSALEAGAARRFKAAMDARGISLVLTFVPTPRPLGGGPALFAELLGVPLIAPHPAGLATEDGDHLDESSAVAWTEAFVRDLGRVRP